MDIDSLEQTLMEMSGYARSREQDTEYEYRPDQWPDIVKSTRFQEMQRDTGGGYSERNRS